ncbi:uncharacterized protein LOC134833703 [Culicoides brevitarsis]|uniref:uncharacterized protein LOC134833703 n=1 Tax=Culicoides brevitarsis TaxID=469753 RepID=UPI00307B2DAE
MKNNTLLTITRNLQFNFIVILLSHAIKSSIGLHLTGIAVPTIADVRDSVSMSCSYNLGSDKLHSVKWYKDDREFFRYAPYQEQQVMMFPAVGVHLTKEPYDPYECGRTKCRITLDNLSVGSTGTYKCEVSGDAPTFPIVFEASNMTVIALPRIDPVISGLGYRYEIGDFVVANCTSDISFPPAILNWYINDIRAPHEWVQVLREQVSVADGFRVYSRSLELRFRLFRKLFDENNSRIKLRCVSNIREVPRAIRESVATIHVPSMDELTNQKLITWSSADQKFTRLSAKKRFFFFELQKSNQDETTKTADEDATLFASLMYLNWISDEKPEQ